MASFLRKEKQTIKIIKISNRKTRDFAKSDVPLDGAELSSQHKHYEKPEVCNEVAFYS